MTLVISKLKNIFLCILECKKSIPMCFSKCYNVDIFSLKEVSYVDEWNHIGQLAGVTLYNINNET